MKLNFFNVLRKKSTPDEIAEQIVGLEIKQRQCETERDQARKGCKDIRSRIMCGEKIPPDVVRNIDKAYENAVLNLEAVTDSIKELNALLATALESLRDELQQRQVDLSGQKDGMNDATMRQVIKAKGRFIGLATALYGYPQEAREQMRNIHSRLYMSSSSPYYADFQEGIREGQAELKHPTVHELESEFESIGSRLNLFKVEEQAHSLLHKHRTQLNVPGPIEPDEAVLA